jgi:hypothetical protein
MKYIILVLFLVANVSFADVFCVLNQEKINVLSERRDECLESLALGENICFTGKRSDAISILKSKKFLEIFEGSDGEYINNVHLKGKNQISYDYVDEGNSYIEKHSIKSCK